MGGFADLGNDLVRGEVRRITSPTEVNFGLGGFAMIQFKVDDRVILVAKDVNSSDGRIFVVPEGLFNLGVQIFISIPRQCVMNRFEIAKMEGKEISDEG